MKKLLLSFALMTFVTTGFAQKQLFLVFSETGTTQKVALEMQNSLNSSGMSETDPAKSIAYEAIQPVEPYSGKFQETIQRGQKEMQSGNLPKLKPLTVDLKNYDIIFCHIYSLGYFS